MLEADAARRLHPKSPAAALWHGRCLLRKCDRAGATAAFVYAGAEARFSELADSVRQAQADLEREEAKKAQLLRELEGDDDEPVLETEEQADRNDEIELKKLQERKEAEDKEILAQEKELEEIEKQRRMPFCCEGPDRQYARTEAAKKLKLLRLVERGERRGKDQYGRGLFKEAAEFYGEAIAAATELSDDRWSRAELLTSRAACYRRGREFSKAVADLNEALKIFPCYKRALFRKGVCLLENQQAGEAVHAFETLMGLDRDWENLLDWLVRAHALDRRIKGGTGPKNPYYPAGDYGYDTEGNFRGEFAPGQKLGGAWAQAPGEYDIAKEKDHYAVLGVLKKS